LSKSTYSRTSVLIYPIWGEVDVGKKITKFIKISGLINRILPANTVRRETRQKVYNTFAMPMLTYGSETWVLRKRDKQRISAAEMRFPTEKCWVYYA